VAGPTRGADVRAAARTRVGAFRAIAHRTRHRCILFGNQAEVVARSGSCRP
jgi:hypothetical protein